MQFIASVYTQIKGNTGAHERIRLHSDLVSHQERESAVRTTTYAVLSSVYSFASLTAAAVAISCKMSQVGFQYFYLMSASFQSPLVLRSYALFLFFQVAVYNVV